MTFKGPRQTMLRSFQRRMTLTHWPILFFDRKRNWTHGRSDLYSYSFPPFLAVFFFLGTNWSTGRDTHSSCVQPILFRVAQVSNPYLNVDVSKSYSWHSIHHYFTIDRFYDLAISCPDIWPQPIPTTSRYRGLEANSALSALPVI